METNISIHLDQFGKEYIRICPAVKDICTFPEGTMSDFRIEQLKGATAIYRVPFYKHAWSLIRTYFDLNKSIHRYASVR
jgi:hypothetical protein